MLIKYTGKYVKIYFIIKITFLSIFLSLSFSLSTLKYYSRVNLEKIIA